MADSSGDQQKDDELDDSRAKVEAPAGQQPGEKFGYPSMAARSRAMREELGGTEGCPACTMSGVWGHGLRHNAMCKKRRAEWAATAPPPAKPRAEEPRGAQLLPEGGPTTSLSTSAGPSSSTGLASPSSAVAS